MEGWGRLGLADGRILRFINEAFDTQGSGGGNFCILCLYVFSGPTTLYYFKPAFRGRVVSSCHKVLYVACDI